MGHADALQKLRDEFDQYRVDAAAYYQPRNSAPKEQRRKDFGEALFPVWLRGSLVDLLSTTGQKSRPLSPECSNNGDILNYLKWGDSVKKTYYDILGVSETASYEEIKKAYRAQIRFFHPDVFDGSPEVANAKTIELNEAYGVLSDAKKRMEYDFLLYMRRRSGQESNPNHEKSQKDNQSTCTEDENTEAYGAATQPISPQEPDIPKNRGYKAAVISVSAVCAVLVIFVFLLGYSVNSSRKEHQQLVESVEALTEQNRELNGTITDLKAKNERAQKQIADLLEERTGLERDLDASHEAGLNMFTDMFNVLYNVGFIVENSRYYHLYTCDEFRNADVFEAHNTRYCEHLGYTKCPDCWN